VDENQETERDERREGERELNRERDERFHAAATAWSGRGRRVGGGGGVSQGGFAGGRERERGGFHWLAVRGRPDLAVAAGHAATAGGKRERERGGFEGGVCWPCVAGLIWPWPLATRPEQAGQAAVASGSALSLPLSLSRFISLSWLSSTRR
jgi:hypothetical protein